MISANFNPLGLLKTVFKRKPPVWQEV